MVAPPLDRRDALDIIESLRSGIPPKRFVSSYSVGTDQFMQDVRRRQLETSSSRGRIRFLSGHWGAGKTHLLRLLREAAFDAGYLVANVELNVDQTPFHHFDRVFFDIVRNISSPGYYAEGRSLSAPFGQVLERAIIPPPVPGTFAPSPHPSADEGTGPAARVQAVTTAKALLLTDAGLDVDFRRLVAAYWDTFLPDAGDELALEGPAGAHLAMVCRRGRLFVSEPLRRAEGHRPQQRPADVAIALPLCPPSRLPRVAGPVRRSGDGLFRYASVGPQAG
jgi:hypothetical protein